MGLFGGKSKTYRDVSFARMIDDAYLPDVIGQAIMKYILDPTNTESMTDLMMEYGQKSLDKSYNAIYRWAKKPGKYYYGVPVAAEINESDFTGSEQLSTVLKQVSGQANLNIIYSRFGTINYRHGAWQTGVSTYGYNPTSNELTALTGAVGATCYLYDMQTHFASSTLQWAVSDVTSQYGLPPQGGQTQKRTQDYSRPDTPYVEDKSVTNNFVLIGYTFRGTQTITQIVTTTTVITTVKTPKNDGSGEYDETTSQTSSSDTKTTTDLGGITIPENIVDVSQVSTNTTNSTDSDPDKTNESTDPNGVITEVVTQVKRDTSINVTVLDVIATTTITTGKYDFVAPTNVDTGTVLDDDDMGNYDPDAPLDPSGEPEGNDPDFYQVCYQYTDAGGKIHTGYFTYEYGSGIYPSLDGIVPTQVADAGSYFPRIYARLDGNRLNQDKYKDTDAYKSSRKLGNKLGIQWESMVDSLHDAIGSLDKVRDIFITMCVPANTTVPIEQRYLYEYFKLLYNLYKPVDPPPKPGSEAELWNAHTGTGIIATDAALSTKLFFDAMGLKTVDGVLTEGAYQSGYMGDSAEGKAHHYFRFQISDTQYEEVRVWGLGSSVSIGGNWQGARTTEESLMVPLDYAFRNSFSPKEREQLYARSLHIAITTEYTVKTKWYQTGPFKIVVTAIAVVASWWTGGASLTLVAALTAVATAVGMQIAFSLASKYIFSKLGGWFAVLALVIAVAAAVYTGYVAVSGTTGAFSLTAQQLMSATNVAFKVQQSAQQGQMIQVQKDLKDIQDEMADKNEELKSAQDLLQNPSSGIPDSVFLSASSGFSYLGETPEDYYSRSLNTNPGLIALPIADVYYAMSLSLPTPVSIFQQMQQNNERPFDLNEDLYNI